jgi:Cu/Ag efflux protein CusF
MRKLTISLALAAAMASVTALAQTATVVAGSAPGVAAAVETESYTGTISAIDAEARMVTVKGDGGAEAQINVGPEAKNFGQLKVGDRVTMELTRALALELRKSSTAEISRQDEADKVGAQAGEAPGGAIGTRTKIMAEVTAVNPESKTVTLKGPNRSIDLAVEDPAQLANIAVGDRVEATYIEAVAFQVTPAAATP